ncbi:MAG: hypothetical protein UT37_C0024G0004 [Parcubacteria group bacterium GW2011_GWA2_39_18]|nr:MAG: hypothetical protein UT37_C0024G0004 [Parcubacteria group bacterium GW2011_GWA2_39_18]
MFIENQNIKSRLYYASMLEVIGSLSRLFSESDEPYIAYRVAENLFCKAFDAKNLSRTDCSADASKQNLGIGVKTFLEKNGATMQKVAEFNSEHALFNQLDSEKKILKIAEMRNRRIETTKRIFALEDLIYHCVTRKPNKILVYETPMDEIFVEKIARVKITQGNTIIFNDGLNEYAFNIAKSTLYKRFITPNVALDLPVNILEDPFSELEKMFASVAKKLEFTPIKQWPHVFLPLYSVRGGRKNVPEKSGLNQWNAGGRSRDPNEVYIPIPAWLHKSFPNFFPPRDTHFELLLPDGSRMEAKLCQDGSKALMSKHNADLGRWLLRDVFDLKEGELLTYEKLEEAGVDSVVIYKAGENKYDIDFTKSGSFDEFEDNEND